MLYIVALIIGDAGDKILRKKIGEAIEQIMYYTGMSDKILRQK